MSYEDNLNMLRKTSKDTYLRLHKTKSDEELRAILMHNAMAAQHQVGAELCKTVGESDACSEILQQRKAKREREEAEQEAFHDALSAWYRSYNERFEEAIINLPVATNYQGQLVAAILEEEDGLTAAEIAKWSAELSEMKEADYKRLLSSLVSEGVIALDKNNKYWLLSVCDKTLTIANPLLWAQKVSKLKNVELSKNQLAFLTTLSTQDEPLTEYDWFELVAFSSSDLANTKNAFNRKYGNSWVMDKLSDLEKLVDLDILKQTPVDGKKWSFYHFPLLGER